LTFAAKSLEWDMNDSGREHLHVARMGNRIGRRPAIPSAPHNESPRMVCQVYL